MKNLKNILYNYLIFLGCLRGDVGAEEPRVHREPLHHGQAQGQAAAEKGQKIIKAKL